MGTQKSNEYFLIDPYSIQNNKSSQKSLKLWLQELLLLQKAIFDKINIFLISQEALKIK
jgi:hypothetical protein